MINFVINKKKLRVRTNKINKEFLVKSGIRDYQVKLDINLNFIKKLFKDNKNIFLIDKNIKNIFFQNIKNENIFVIESLEKNKNTNLVNKIIDFFIKKKVTKINTIVAIGGGIVQDIAGYSCYVFKRGIPWIYLPTTMLGQTDSCVGGKVALNYKNIKNVMALFSAPRKIYICNEFLNTTSSRDFLSGVGEAFRLHITGGRFFFNQFKKELPQLIKKDKKVIKKVILRSLLIKKTIVEKDEYEIDIRRSMNFGHSIGHAYEALLNYKIPHGLAVAIGICIELLLSINEKEFSKKMMNDIIDCFLIFFPKKYLLYLKNLNLSKINSILQQDKKTEGNIVKLAVPINYGNMKFINRKLDNENIKKIYNANSTLLKLM
jgi:3-dehydroquinate synthase